MIQEQTILKVADNSGAKFVKCIRIPKGFKRKYANLGDIITVSVNSLRNKSKKTSKVLKGEIYKAVIIRIKKKYRTKTGIYSNFNGNYVCLLNKQTKPVATRILGPISKILKRKSFIKLINISGGFV